MGRSGRLIFVTILYETSGSNGVAIVEEQDLVYKQAAVLGQVAPPDPTGAAPPAAWQEQILPDPPLLFRYSALTMNGHRIH